MAKAAKKSKNDSVKDKKENKVAKKKTGKKSKSKTFKIQDINPRTTLVTDIGQFGYMYLTEPNQKGKYDKDKYTAVIMWDEKEWKAKRKDSKGKKLETIQARVEGALLEIAKKAYKDPKITLDDFQHPIKFGNDQDDPNIYGDKVYIIGKRSLKYCEKKGLHKVFGPKTKDGPFDEESIKKIKPGDYGRLVLVVYPYIEGSEGISFGLDCLQLQQSGPALTGGVEASAKMLDDLDVELDDVEEPDEEGEEDEDEDDDGEDDDESGDAEESDDADDADDDDDDEEDEDEDADDDEGLESFEQ